MQDMCGRHETGMYVSYVCTDLCMFLRVYVQDRGLMNNAAITKLVCMYVCICVCVYVCKAVQDRDS
jgi:hypothetical protein